MKQVRYHKYHELATYCKSEGINLDYFMSTKRIMNNENPWIRDAKK